MREATSPHSDAAVLEAVDEALAAGDRDLLEGGVTPTDVAQHCGLSPDRLQDRFRALEVDGELSKVWGADPETYRARVSWLPADHPDATLPEC